MTCTISQEKIAETITFHGHSCPGLAIGIRVADYVRQEFGEIPPEQLICVTETDMCAVDGIQFLTGCTFGKGNLIHRDYGKAAFSFYNLATERAFRLVLRPESRGGTNPEMAGLMAKSGKGQLAAGEHNRLTELRGNMQERLMTLPLAEMFTLQELTFAPPRGARVLQSLACESCGEQTMESRTRRFGGRTLCIPCFAKVEQKV